MSMTTATPVRIGVVGGTGLYEMDNLADVQEVTISTPYGDPSDAITVGTLNGIRIAFLPRHGRGHRISPSEIPVRANIHALKQLGVERLISVSAVGSLRRDIEPLDIVVPDQLIDRTKQRDNTFFSEGLVAHIAFGDPFCLELSELLGTAAGDTDATVHEGGTYVVMEGPSFSTRAESELYRSWGADIIGMTALPEAKLAREAEMCFAVLATATDYDSWHPEHEDVTVDVILANLAENVKASQKTLQRLIPRLNTARRCGCQSALETAIVTAPELVPKETLEKLGPIVSKYIGLAKDGA